jgi:hypothetical protein
MASASLAKFAETLDEDSNSHSEAQTMSAFLKFCSLVAVDNKKPATEKTKRENWHDTDSAEGKAILAGNKPKPRKTKSVDTDAFANLIESIPLEALLEAMSKARR